MSTIKICNSNVINIIYWCHKPVLPVYIYTMYIGTHWLTLYNRHFRNISWFEQSYFDFVLILTNLWNISLIPLNSFDVCPSTLLFKMLQNNRDDFKYFNIVLLILMIKYTSVSENLGVLMQVIKSLVENKKIIEYEIKHCL